MMMMKGKASEGNSEREEEKQRENYLSGKWRENCEKVRHKAS